MRKFRRRKLPERPVLIAKPHNVENLVDERVNTWCMKAFQRGIAEYVPCGTKQAELGRNTIINEFRDNEIYRKCTHIFFLDADTEPFDDFAIERLLSLKKPVIAGVTPIVMQRPDHLACMWSPVIKKENGELENIGIGEMPKKPFIAQRTGGTTLLIERRVINDLKPPYQRSTYNSNWTNISLSEDRYFSDKIREAGYNIWIDPETVCHHYHKIDLLDLFAIGMKALKKK